MPHRLMPLVRIPEPFDHPDWLFELKHDGFRALAHVEGHRCRLLSRGGHTFGKWDVLCEEIAHSVRCLSAVLDGELVCLEPDGRSNFYRLMFRRDWPYFYAFDVLSIDDEDLRDRPLVERKHRLQAIMPRVASRLLYVDLTAQVTGIDALPNGEEEDHPFGAPVGRPTAREIMLGRCVRRRLGTRARRRRLRRSARTRLTSCVRFFTVGVEQR